MSGLQVPSSFTPALGLHNATSSNLAHWRKLKADVLAGTASGSIAMIGDSTTAGVGGNAPQRRNSYPYFVSRKLAFAGVTTRYDSFFGYAGRGSLADYTVYNPAVTFGTGWATGSNTLGGAIFTAGSSITTALSYTPTAQATVADIYYQQGSGFGTFTVDVGGAALATVNSGSPTTAALVKVTVTLGTLGAYTINVKRNGTGGAIFIAGIVVRDANTTAVDVINMGWGGSTSTDWNDASFPARPRAAISVVAPALCIINLGINDQTPATLVPLATYTANLTAWVTTLLGQGTDVILAVPTPRNPTRTDLATQAQYDQAVRDVATANGVPWLDMTEVWGSYAFVSSLNYMSDDVHPFTRGYADESDIFLRALSVI